MTEQMQNSRAEITQRQRVYASMYNPTINAAVKSLFTFETERQAQARIKQIKHDFVTSKQGDNCHPVFIMKSGNNNQKDHTTQRVLGDNRVIIWIEDFALSKEKKLLGYKGNFAILSIAPKDGNRFTIVATKIDAELKFHPQRHRPKGKHPDWGHPILRDIQKKRIYFSLEEASGELARLHADYPTISIPAEHRLLIIIYGKSFGEKPFKKYKFIVRPLPDGTFIIEYKENIPRTKIPNKIISTPDGYFSQKEKIRRSIKKKPPVFIKTENK